jgi:hypothetical protein
LKQQIAVLQTNLAQIKTPQQAAQAIPQYFPSVQPTPVTVNIPAQPATSTTPATPAHTEQVFTLTNDQLMSLAKQGEQCKECQLNLIAEKTANEGLQTQFTNCQTEVSTWKKAAKGGSFWHRLTHDIKVVGISVATGAVIGAVAVKVLNWRQKDGTIRNWIRSSSDSSNFDRGLPQQSQVSY